MLRRKLIMGEKKMPNDGNETFDMEHLLELAREKKYRLLKEELVELNEVDIASFIEELDSERTVIVFRMLPKALATEVFAELPVDKQSHIINSITDKELSEIVEELYVDDAVDLVEELPATVVRRVLQNTNPETRKLINQFLNYPENTAGSIMTAEYIGLKKNMTVEQCFACGSIPSLYNYPLCLFDRKYWYCYRNSISDYKIRYFEECEKCTEKSRCGGFFASTYRYTRYKVRVQV